jgi:hypothetical protein
MPLVTGNSLDILTSCLGRHGTLFFVCQAGIRTLSGLVFRLKLQGKEEFGEDVNPA